MILKKTMAGRQSLNLVSKNMAAADREPPGAALAKALEVGKEFCS